MQEVQTTLDYKADLNLIEGVGRQENRIKEHTQVEPAFSYSCTVYGQADYQVQTSESRESTTNQGNLSITESVGITEFKIEDGGLRIPLAGPYLAEISLAGGGSTATMTNYIKIGDRIIYQLETTSSTPVVNEVVLNLGRYDVISFWGKMYYSGSADSATGWSRLTLKLKRL